MRRAVLAVAAAVGLLVAGAVTLVALTATRGGPGSPPPTDGVYAVWERNTDGSPVRWDPCRPIQVAVSPMHAPPGALRDVEVALDLLAEASGLRLVLAGATDERPSATRPAHTDVAGELHWAPVLVAWAAPGEGDIPLRSTDRGIAIPLAVGRDGDRTYVTAQVVLNREQGHLEPGFADRSTSWGATLVHELAHVLGLDHVDDPAELLWTHPGEGAIELGPGDLAGLEAVGADGGCVVVPDPQVVELHGLVPSGRQTSESIRRARPTSRSVTPPLSWVVSTTSTRS